MDGERPGDRLGDLWAAAFMGSCFGVTLIVGYFLVQIGGELGGAFKDYLLVGLSMWIIGLIFAQISVVPLGTFVGWLLTLRSDASLARCAYGGTLTGAIAGFAITAGSLWGDGPMELKKASIITLLLLTATGCASGLFGFWTAFYRRRRTEAT